MFAVHTTELYEGGFFLFANTISISPLELLTETIDPSEAEGVSVMSLDLHSSVRNLAINNQAKAAAES